MRILMIEDTLIAQVAEAALLEDLGYEVTIASTGREAIEKTKAGEAYQLILLDLGLPDIDAITVSENILENYAQHKKTPPPIIALTAYASDSFRAECTKAGMTDFLAKPLTEEVARSLLKKY